MKIYSNGKDRVLKGDFPTRFKLLNAGVEVPFIRTGKQSVRLSGDIPFGELDIEEIVRKKVPQPAKLDAENVAIINKKDFDQIDILSKKLTINQEQMNNHLSALIEQEASLANLETQNAQAIDQTNLNMVEMAKAFGKEIQADRDALVATSENIKQVLSETAEVLDAKLQAHEVAKNPHKITKATVGLDAVDNTSDLDKPVSKATQKALDKKADKSDIENLDKRLLESDKKQDSLMRNLETVNLYGGVGGNELPTGGKKGQILSKKSNKDGDYEWSSTAGGVTIHNDLTGRSVANAHPISAITGLQDALTSETTNRENADNGLQSQIDAITASSDVKDIVGTYAQLQAYDTSTLGNNDIIKVLQDETHSDETTYYRWSTVTETFTLIGEEGPYYTKSEANSTFVPQTRTVNGKALSADISLTASDVGALPDNTTIGDATLTIQKNGTTIDTFTANATSNKTVNVTVPTDTSDLTNGAGYTTNVGTVTSVNNNSPDSNGNVTLSIPTINSTNNYVPYRSSATSFGNSTLLYNSNAMAFTGRLHVGSSSPASYYNKGRFTVYDNTPSQQVSSLALLNYGGGGGCGVAIDMYNTSANGGIPSGRFGVIDNGNYSGYLQLQVKKSGAQSNPLLPAMNIVPVPATSSLTTCVSFGQDEFNRVLFDLHKPEATTTITDSDKRWGGSGTTYQVTGSNKFNPRLLVAVGDIVSFNNFSTEATVTGVVSNSSTLQITTNVSLGTVSNANISVKKAYFKITDESYNTKVYIDPYGKFGIGTGTPSTELDVSGTINASTDIKIGGNSLATVSKTGDYNDLLNTPTIPSTASEVGALPDTTKYGADLSLTSDTLQLLDQDGNALGNSVTVPDASNFANKDLSNLSSTGKNIGNWSSNVTNCITYIPQDIKLELNDGTLTLKAGSKVYNGNGLFAEVQTDVSLSSANYNGQVVVLYASTGVIATAVMGDSVASLPSPSVSYKVYYNTTDKKCYLDTGTWLEVSFPIAFATSTVTAFTSIDQVFNGFGYIGSTVFALPGVKGLIPNGRNADGTLRSTEFTTPSVLVGTFPNTYTADAYIVLSASTCGAVRKTLATYDYKNNFIIFSGAAQSVMIAGNISTSAGVVLSLTPKKVYEALDSNDGNLISRLCMPSSRYVTLTLGSNGASYTAPANGYFSLGGNDAQTANCRYVMRNDTTRFGVTSNTNGASLTTGWMAGVLPVRKGDIVHVYYNGFNSTGVNFIFVYAEGEA